MLIQGVQLATGQEIDCSTYEVFLVPGLLEALEEVLLVLGHPSKPHTRHLRLFAFLDCERDLERTSNVRINGIPCNYIVKCNNKENNS